MKNNECNKVYFIVIVKYTIFGMACLFTKKLLENISMFDLLAFRFLIAALTFELFRRFKLVNINLKGKSLKKIILISCLMPIGYYALETLGLKSTSTLMTGIICSLMPIITVFLETLILKEKTNMRQRVFIIIGIIGVIFITIMSNTSGEKSSLIGMLFIFLALLCEGFYNIFSREESAKFDPMEITYVMMWFGAIGFNLINVCIRMANHTILSYFTPLLNSSNVVSLLYLGVLSSGVAYVMYNYALSKIPASSVNAFAGVVTVVTILSGVLLNNEKFLWFHAIGGILILLGAWGTNHFRAVYKLEEKVQKRVVEQEQVRF